MAKRINISTPAVALNAPTVDPVTTESHRNTANEAPPQAKVKLTERLAQAGMSSAQRVSDAWARANLAFEEALEISGEVSFKRQVASFLLATITVCGIWYLIAPVIAATLLATSTYGFIGMVASVLVLLAAWFTAAKAGQLVYNLVMAKTVEHGVTKAWSTFKTLFDRKPKAITLADLED